MNEQTLRLYNRAAWNRSVEQGVRWTLPLMVRENQTLAHAG